MHASTSDNFKPNRCQTKSLPHIINIVLYFIVHKNAGYENFAVS